MSAALRARLAALVCAAALVAWGAPARAVPAQQLVARARESAARGSWNESARALEELVAAGYTGDRVLYDLGVAYARAGRFGEALHRFEQVSRRSLFAGDAQHNLRVARLALAHRDAARTGRAVVEAALPTRVWLGELAPPHVAGLAAVLFELGLLGCALALRRRRAARALLVDDATEAPRLGKSSAAKAERHGGEVARVALAAGAALCALGAAGSLAVCAARASSPAAGVVLREGVRLLRAPSADAISDAPVREGARVELLARVGAFVRVRARDDAAAREGWVPGASVGALDGDGASLR